MPQHAGRVPLAAHCPHPWRAEPTWDRPDATTRVRVEDDEPAGPLSIMVIRNGSGHESTIGAQMTRSSSLPK